MYLVLFLFPSSPPNSSFRLKALPPWFSVPRFLAEIKLICIMKVGPIQCTERGLKKTTTFIIVRAGMSHKTEAKVK